MASCKLAVRTTDRMGLLHLESIDACVATAAIQTCSNVQHREMSCRRHTQILEHKA